MAVRGFLNANSAMKPFPVHVSIQSKVVLMLNRLSSATRWRYIKMSPRSEFSSRWRLGNSDFGAWIGRGFERHLSTLFDLNLLVISVLVKRAVDAYLWLFHYASVIRAIHASPLQCLYNFYRCFRLEVYLNMRCARQRVGAGLAAALGLQFISALRQWNAAPRHCRSRLRRCSRLAVYLIFSLILYRNVVCNFIFVSSLC